MSQAELLFAFHVGPVKLLHIFSAGYGGSHQGFSGFFWACVSAGMNELEEVYVLFLILWGREMWGQGQGFHVYSEFLP